MENMDGHVTTSSSEEFETGYGEAIHEVSEFEERDISMRASRHEESDRDEDDTDSNSTDSDEHVKGNGKPLSTSSNEEIVAGSNEELENWSVLPSSSRIEENDTNSSSESSGGDIDVEEEQIHNASGDSSIDVCDLQSFTEGNNESKADGGANMQENTQPLAESRVADVSLQETHSPEAKNMQETQKSAGVVPEDHHETSLPVDEADEGSIEITPETGDESNKQVSAGTVGAPVSTHKEGNQGDRSTNLQSCRTSIHEENKPTSSEVNLNREIEPALMQLDEDNMLDSLKADDEHANKGLTCDGNMTDDDEQLREYWTRALQTSTSTGEVVEEIVKVLKHHQKTHDLLCPVCGSCVTRRVILRKRKRSSVMSVDRWYLEPEDEGEARECVEEQEAKEHQDTEAFGCLSCFSLFIAKGRQVLNQLQADIAPEALNCLPFFFPPYPWGMTEMKSRSPGVPSQEVIEASEEPSTTDVSLSFSCGISSALLPDYPWGTMPLLSKEGSTSEEVEEAASSDVREPAQTIAQSDYTCGIGSTLLPVYPWGTMPSKGEVMQPQNPIDTPVVDEGQGVSQTVDIKETAQSLFKERTCTCGLVPAMLPDYPWGYCTKSEPSGAPAEPTPIVPQAQTADEIKGKGAEDKGFSCDVVSAVLPDYPWGTTTEHEVLEEGPSWGERLQNSAHVDCSSAILPSYPWGVCSVNQSVQEQNNSAQMLQGARSRDCTCGLGPAMWPKFPWGQPTLSTVHKKDENGFQQVQSYIEQQTKIEAIITTKTDVLTVTTSKTTYPEQKPPPSIKTMSPQQTSQTVQHVKLDQKVTIVNASVSIEDALPSKESSLASLPSMGYALLDLVEEGVSEKGRLESKPSTGYAHLEDMDEEEESLAKRTTKAPKQPHKSKISTAPPPWNQDELEPPESEIQEDPMSIKYPQPQSKPESTQQSIPEEIFYKPGKTIQPSGTPFPSFQWAVGKVDAGGDLTTPLLKASVESDTETFISVLKPSPGVDESKSENWLSVFKVSKPTDEEGITSLLLPPKAQGYEEEIVEVKLPTVQRPQISTATEAVIDVPPADLSEPSVRTLPSTDVALPAIKKEADGWDILKSIVYGGLDISVASLGVTSSAAGGNAITRTVVYMGLATLLSGLIGFYHNVLNLYHYHRDHYTDMVGISLMLHGTVAIISYVVFGLLSPLIYAFSYRKTDDRDDKFLLCCGVTIVTVTVLALGKAKVSNKRYIRTPSSYLLGGVLAAVVGYLTGEHVAELLEEWGI